MLAAMEGYSFIPNSFGAKPADLGTREEMGKLRTLSDKAQVIDHLTKGLRAREETAGRARRGHAHGQAQGDPRCAAEDGSRVTAMFPPCAWADRP
jgi:hypothetical protein